MRDEAGEDCSAAAGLTNQHPHPRIFKWPGQLASISSFAIQPSRDVREVEQYWHRFGMHVADSLVGFASEERHESLFLAGPPDAGERKQFWFALSDAEPNLALTPRPSIRFSGPFAECRYGNDATVFPPIESAPPKRAGKVPHVGHRSRLGCGRAGKTPGHNVQFQPPIFAPEYWRRATRIYVAEQRQVRSAGSFMGLGMMKGET